MISHMHAMLAPWWSDLLKRELAFAWCMTCPHIARVLTFLVVMGVTWRIFRLSMYRDSWALTCAMTCARNAVTVRDRSLMTWYVLVLLIVMCDYFRSLSGLRYQCRAYHLRWLRCDHDTRTLPQMTQVTVMILATHYYIATSSCYHYRHCNIAHDHVTCMITSAFRVVISSIINWISWFWPPCHCHRAC